MCLRKPGDHVVEGETLAELHARSEDAATEAAHELEAAYVIADEQPARRSVVLDVLA